MPLPLELAQLKEEIQEVARGYGLDFFDVIFHVLDYDGINEIAAYGGFPTRYPHWRFGMEYGRLKKGYSYGLQKIYEMVINNDPCHAYLLSANNIVDQKTVMAHVYGHCDFFKNNVWFSKTNRKMLDEMANHGVRIRKYMERYGLEKVESFIDACLSIENLIDYHAPFIQRTEQLSRGSLDEAFRILKENGLLVVAVPNLHNAVLRFFYRLVKGKSLALFSTEAKELHLYHFSETTLTGMLQKAGFEIIAVKPDLSAVVLGRRLMDAVSAAICGITGKNYSDGIKVFARKKTAETVEPGTP